MGLNVVPNNVLFIFIMEKTHKVIDLVYADLQDPEAIETGIVGTPEECYAWVKEQGGFGYMVIPLSKPEFKKYNEGKENL